MSKPTQEKLERVFEAAKEHIRVAVVGFSVTSAKPFVEVPRGTFCALSDAVRAAERPRWTLADYGGHTELHGPAGEVIIVRKIGDFYGLAGNLLAILNAKGGKP